MLQPVCHTLGQTHGALSITRTYAVASISSKEVHAKPARCSRVFSLFSVMNHILLNKQNTQCAPVPTSHARRRTNDVCLIHIGCAPPAFISRSMANGSVYAPFRSCQRNLRFAAETHSPAANHWRRKLSEVSSGGAAGINKNTARSWSRPCE